MMAEDAVAKHYIEFSVGEPFANATGVNLHHLENNAESEAYQSWRCSHITPPGGKYFVSPESEWFLPTFSLSYYYQVLPWLQVGAEASTFTKGIVWKSRESSQEKYPYYLKSDLNLAAAVRFNYYHRNITDLYSGLALGTSIRMHSSESQAITSSAAWVAWSVTALGVRFGKQVYGNVEIGWGYKGFFSAGVGVRL